MRLALLLTGILLMPAASSAQSAGADTFAATCRAAMDSYYSALLSSAHGDSEGTLRQILLLRAKWEALVRAAPAGGQAWAQDVTGGQSVLAAVTAMIERARQDTAARDIAEAHSELEGIRVALRDARARHGVRMVDDALTDYHDAMERLTGRVGMRNEIVLNAEDYGAIRDQTTRASAAWAEIGATTDPVARLPGWRDSVARTATVLATLQKAAAEQDAVAAQRAAAELKTHYFELLRILSRG
jgi:hypothetical protein